MHTCDSLLVIADVFIVDCDLGSFKTKTTIGILYALRLSTIYNDVFNIAFLTF